MRLLVVEDDPTSLAMLAHVIEGLGYELTRCPDGEAAWESYQALRHELLVVDWMLPGMDGLELCRRVRAFDGGDLSVILMITGHEQSIDLKGVLEAGADDYLTKPIDAARLSVRLAIAKERHRARVREREAEQSHRFLEEQARRHQEIERFAVSSTGIAYDLDNILVGIHGLIDLARADIAPDSPARQALAQIAQSAHRAQGLVQDILTLSHRADVPRYAKLHEAEAAGHGGEHILLVDDEVLLAELGKQALERRGYRVTAITDSRAALEAFRADPGAFDVVVTDQTMPHLKGDDLAAELLCIRPDVPILITTGFSDVVAEGRAKALGIREVLDKPVSTTELVRAMRQALGQCT